MAEIPPSTESSDSLKLEGFMWLDNIRPKNKKEVFEKFRAGFEASPDVNTHLH